MAVNVVLHCRIGLEESMPARRSKVRLKRLDGLSAPSGDEVDLHEEDADQQDAAVKANTGLTAESPHPPDSKPEEEQTLEDPEQNNGRPSRRRAQPNRYSEESPPAKPTEDKEMSRGPPPRSRRSTRRQSAEVKERKDRVSQEEMAFPDEAHPAEESRQRETIKVCSSSVMFLHDCSMMLKLRLRS